MITGIRIVSRVHLIINRNWNAPLTICFDGIPVDEDLWKAEVSATSTLKLAIEVFFDIEDVGIGLYGIDLTQLPTENQIAFIESITRHYGRYTQTTILMEAWKKWIMPSGSAHFFSNCSAIDVVPSIHWSDTLVYHLWDRSNEHPQVNNLLEVATSCKYLHEPQGEEIMLEFQYDSPIPHWYAIQASKALGGKHWLLLGSVAKILSAYAEQVGF